MKKLLILLFLLPLMAIGQTTDLKGCFIKNDTLFCKGNTLVGASFAITGGATTGQFLYWNETLNKYDTVPYLQAHWDSTNGSWVLDSARLRAVYFSGDTGLIYVNSTQVASLIKTSGTNQVNIVNNLIAGDTLQGKQLTVLGQKGANDLALITNENSNLIGDSGSVFNKLGYLGIGANPVNPLDVFSTSVNRFNITTDGLMQNYISGAGLSEVYRTNMKNTNIDGLAGYWAFYTNTDVSADFFGRIGFRFDGGVADANKQFGIFVASTAAPKVVINGSGNMGIGNTMPTTAKLSIDGNKTTLNLFEAVNDNDGLVGDSSLVITKLGQLLGGGSSFNIGTNSTNVITLTKTSGTNNAAFANTGNFTDTLTVTAPIIANSIVHVSGLIADNDATPDVTGKDVWIYNGSANSVTVTDLDNPTVGTKYTIIGNSDTYILTINDGGNFSLSGGVNFSMGINDVIVLYCIADNNYIEVSRSDN
jgi:hypothetical protein